MSTDQSSTKSISKNPTSDNNEISKAMSEESYPPTSKAVLVTFCLFLCAFLISLDRLIIGVAIPSITDEFHSLGDIGWYGSAYLLTSCAFMLFMGKVYTLWNPKWVYLGSLMMFELGSAVSGAAPNSTALIVGRAIAGLGNAGLLPGMIIIIVHIVPLSKRPQYMGFGGLVIGAASSLGPLLGGAFTDGPGWRWCFYINLPCGAAVFVLLLLFVDIPEQLKHQEVVSFREKLARLDLIGTACFLPSIVCLLLALQWGGLNYAWSNVRIIVLLVISGALFIAFVIVQWWQGDNATVPGRIFRNRSILAANWFSFFSGSAMQVLVYYLPIWFQAIKGVSAVKSGIMSLPLVLGLVITTIMAGGLTKRLGYYTPWMILSAMMTSVGSGLISTFSAQTTHPAWIGYQVLFGLGCGFGMQQPSVAAQTVLTKKDVPVGAALTKWTQSLGGALMISVANNIFVSRLGHDLTTTVSGIDVQSIVSAGATGLRTMVSASTLSSILIAYNDALRTTFYLATALSCLTIFGAVTMEWKSVKQRQGQDKQRSKQAIDAEEAGEKQFEKV